MQILTVRLGNRARVDVLQPAHVVPGEGAFASLAHLIALQGKQKVECAADWFFKDKEAKRKLVEETMADNPNVGPTTVIISLLTQACGPLVSKPIR